MPMTIKCTIRSAALFLAVICSVTPAHARDYLIEVVLFETLGGKKSTNQGLYLPRIENSLRLGSESAVANGFLPMEQNLKLTANAASIAASGNYRLLRHLSWRQPGLSDADAKAIRISMGSTYPLYIPDNTDDYPEFIPGSASPTPQNPTQIETSTLRGTLKIRLGRFLHMDTRLVYTDTANARSFRMSQSRKMRSGELHFIDNPGFGLLTRITPLEDKAGTANADSVVNEALEAPE